MAIYLSLLLDYLLGDPKFLPHPVVLVGKLIAFYEKLLYPAERDRRFRRGALLAALVLLTVGLVLAALLWMVARWPLAQFALGVYLLYAALAWRSLQVEPGYVAAALRAGNLPRARKMLSYVVGRDTENLNGQQIIKAVLETIAENTIDGVLAPLFYMCLGYFGFGLPGAVICAWLYKAINTMDSMIGYKNDRYQEFGTFAARLDDVANLLPARLGAMLMLLAGAMLGYDAAGGWRVWLRDRYAHKSPNSAQSESVLAGLLGLRLGGPAYYFGKLVVKPTIGDERRAPQLADYGRACRVLNWSVILSTVIFTFFFLYRYII